MNVSRYLAESEAAQLSEESILDFVVGALISLTIVAAPLGVFLMIRGAVKSHRAYQIRRGAR